MRAQVVAGRNEDGGRIKELVMNSGFAPETIDFLDWSDIEPYWLVARLENGIVGCIQWAIAKPIGRIEYLSTEEDLAHIQRARVVKALLETSLSVLTQAGCQLASGTVPFGYKSYARLLKKRGAVKQAQGNVFIKRLM